MKTGAARRLDPEPHDDPTPETFLEEIQRIFESGTLRGAREVAAEGLNLYPDHAELRRLHHALRPTEVRMLPGYKIPDRQDTFEWIRDKAESYRGQWVAVLGTDPIAASPDLEEVRQAVRSRKLPARPLFHSFD
ncbi:MAG TPA: DUF5678 domain-containing protein [Thermoanaerobaculia bacterium]|nr:DUF5678 domain-containing protein [Thermoanaerobaculia bacterium]